MTRKIDDVRCDYLVIGGGTAGCIMAARLSEDPAVRVVLLEAGPEDTDPWIHIPAGYARLFASGKFDWKYQTEAEPELGGRKINWPRGKVLGGSGSINGLVIPARLGRHDYDRWAQSGARGWSYADVLPTFQGLEDWQGAPNPQRGTGGPVPRQRTPHLVPGCRRLHRGLRRRRLPPATPTSTPTASRAWPPSR